MKLAIVLSSAVVVGLCLTLLLLHGREGKLSIPPQTVQAVQPTSVGSAQSRQEASDALDQAAGIVDRLAIKATDSQEERTDEHLSASDRWDQLPRIGVTKTLQWFAFLSDRSATEQLLRSEALNPDDKRIPESYWQVLADVVKLYQVDWKRISDLRRGQRMEELGSLFATGRMLRLDGLPDEELEYVSRQVELRGAGLSSDERDELRRQLLRRRHRALGRNVFYSPGDGEEYVVAESELPETTRIAALEDVVEELLLIRVMDWFIERGVLPPEATAQLLLGFRKLNETPLGK